MRAFGFDNCSAFGQARNMCACTCLHFSLRDRRGCDLGGLGGASVRVLSSCFLLLYFTEPPLSLVLLTQFFTILTTTNVFCICYHFKVLELLPQLMDPTTGDGAFPKAIRADPTLYQDLLTNQVRAAVPPPPSAASSGEEPRAGRSGRSSSAVKANRAGERAYA